MRDARIAQLDYVAEGRVRQVAAEAGVLPEAIEDVVTRFRAHQFTEAELPAKLKEWRDTPKHHFFNVAGSEDNDLFVQAFGPNPSITDQGTVQKKYGAQRAAEIAAQFGTTLGTGKPGRVPEHIKTNGGDHSANPFTRLRDGTGKINAAAAAEVAGMTKRLGTKKVEAIARAVGKTITGLPLRA